MMERRKEIGIGKEGENNGGKTGDMNREGGRERKRERKERNNSHATQTQHKHGMATRCSLINKEHEDH